MKTIVAVGIWLLIASLVSAQAVVLDVSGAAPGRYYYAVDVSAAGKVTLTQLEAIKLGKPVPPAPTPDLSTRAKQIKEAAAAVSGDANRETTATSLAALYREVEKQIADGKIKGREQVSLAIKTGTDVLLERLKSVATWQPVRSVITDQFTALVQEGGTDAQYAAWLGEVADGLEASAPQPQAINLQQIMEIIKIILELLEKLFPPQP